MVHSNDQLLKLRFELNMARIAKMVELTETLRTQHPKITFERHGAEAEVLRAVVVFLHTTFEVALRSYQPKSRKSFTFSGNIDLDQALRQSGVSPSSFKSLYPPLVQMARRRNRIAHHADLE